MCVTTVDLINADRGKDLIMAMKFKKADGRIFYLPMKINCKKFKTKIDKDGFIEDVKCYARKDKTKCKTCELNKRK